MSDATYMRSAFPPFDMADEVPAMADYLELMERYNPERQDRHARHAGPVRPSCCSPSPPTSAAPS